jgi:hypothetical protein
VFTLDGTYLLSISIQSPAHIFVVGDVIWICAMRTYELTILSKDGIILADNLTIMKSCSITGGTKVMYTHLEIT